MWNRIVNHFSKHSVGEYAEAFVNMMLMLFSLFLLITLVMIGIGGGIMLAVVLCLTPIMALMTYTTYKK